MDELLLKALQDQLDSLQEEAKRLDAKMAQLQDFLQVVKQELARKKDEAPVETKSDEPEIEVELILPDEEEETELEEAPAPEPAPAPQEEAKVETEPEPEVVPAPAPAPAKEEKVETEPEPEVVPAPKPVPQEPETKPTRSLDLPAVDDIRKAISLGDRFLFQRELFHSDGEKMNKTLDLLNGMASLEEAEAFLDKKFDWDKQSTAYELFHNILKRRF